MGTTPGSYGAPPLCVRGRKKERYGYQNHVVAKTTTTHRIDRDVGKFKKVCDHHSRGVEKGRNGGNQTDTVANPTDKGGNQTPPNPISSEEKDTSENQTVKETDIDGI